MCKILSIINQKGGTGKTSLVLNLGHLLAQTYKVLLLDTDPQKNLTYTLSDGVDEDFHENIYHIFMKKLSINDCIVNLDKLDYVPSSENLSALDKSLKDMTILKSSIDSIKKNYDFVIIDTPPNLGSITISSIIASNSLVVPTEASIYSLNGVKQLVKTLDSINRELNLHIKIEGILLTRYKNQTKDNRELAGLLESSSSYFNTKVFNSKIRDSIAVSKAQSKNLSVFDTDKNSKVAMDYQNFTKELLKSLQK